jgi:hypothetical protein
MQKTKHHFVQSESKTAEMYLTGIGKQSVLNHACSHVNGVVIRCGQLRKHKTRNRDYQCLTLSIGMVFLAATARLSSILLPNLVLP